MDLELLIQIGAGAGAIAAVGAATTVIVKMMRVVREFTRGGREVFEDWLGVADRPGVPGRPGVMEQLKSLTNSAADNDTRLAEIEQEIKPNVGGSLRDAVDDTKHATQRIEKKLCDHVNDNEAHGRG